MAWTVQLSRGAVKQLEKIPPDYQLLVGRAIDAMEEDPFQGDVTPLKGRKWRGRYRKRVGRYRLIFVPVPEKRLVEISAVLVRSEKTYR